MGTIFNIAEIGNKTLSVRTNLCTVKTAFGKGSIRVTAWSSTKRFVCPDGRLRKHPDSTMSD